MLEILSHTIIDTIKLLPFLFITYLIMEYIEHKTSNKAKETIKKSGKFGPFFGSLLGIVPQCGFSVVATNLYAVRVISLGTLIAIYLSTSDEMLPILISEAVPIWVILKILSLKFLIGIIAGFAIDLILRKRKNDKQEEYEIKSLCEHDHCHCENGIIKSALKHTINIFIFIFIITFVINILIHVIGEDTLSHFILNQPILGPILSGIIGLIPNCASSVIITQLYLEQVITLGTMMAGSLVSAGVGLMVLCKVNHNAKDNIKIIGLLYSIGVIAGILIELIG